MSVLFCPAHYRFTENEGSEFYATFALVNRLANRVEKATVVTGKNISGKHAYRIIETHPSKNKTWMQHISDWTVKNSMSFLFSYHLKGFKELYKEKYIILHHVRPFSIGTTFSLLPFIFWNTKFVIGSFCAPYSDKVLQSERKNEKDLKNFLKDLAIKFLRPIINQLSKLTLKRANAILVTDKDAKNYLIQRKIEERKIFIIPHGKPRSEFTYIKSKSLKTEINLLVIGHLIPRKRVLLALKAFHYAQSRDSRLRLHIVGDGIERKSLEFFISKNNLKNYVTLHGRIPYSQVKNLYNIGHILLHCAEEEMFAHVYLEAIASGIPIVGTPTIGSKNICNDDFSVICEPESKILAESIISIFQNEEEYRQRCENARRFFETNFEIDKVVIPSVLKIYNKLYENDPE